jgi:hypothetical protein
MQGLADATFEHDMSRIQSDSTLGLVKLLATPACAKTQAIDRICGSQSAVFAASLIMFG